ncbi:MAG TPA: polysaccharide pyruvyl transferase family protein [Sedimentisphaerales bacterium]|nr:polysaccharide pyruvyl transferase family protein [Sedimentisphaerales bacterium]
MRVGILTFHHVPNYGAVLQAYALSHAVRDLGHDPLILDYRPWRATTHYLWAAVRTRPWMPEMRRILRIQRFVRRELPLSKRRIRSGLDIGGIDATVDAQISGSDQIWCWGKPWTYRKYDSAFFLAHTRDGIRRIAYAPSCGGMTSFGSRVREAAALLNRFDALSARDENTQRLVQEATGRVCELVLDPIFLHDFGQLEAPASCRVSASPYMVVCGTLSARDRARLKMVSLALGLRSVSMFQFDSAADENILDPEPTEWLSIIRNASFVVTNLFHGLAFTLHFGRPFAAVTTSYSGAKITDLLRRLRLTHRSVDHVDLEEFVGMASKREDLDRALAELELARSASLQFLRTSLAACDADIGFGAAAR